MPEGRNRRRTYAADLVRNTIESMVHGCDYPDCEQMGTHPAPRARNRLRDYLWFCLEHVRAYNASWNYYAGMSEEEIEAEIRKDTVWQRPTWRWGARQFDDMRDPFDILSDDEPPRGRAKPAAARRPPRAIAEALAVFDLESPVTAFEVKARYKELVKRHHPDAHGGDKAAEEKLKTINIAYAELTRLVAS